MSARKGNKESATKRVFEILDDLLSLVGFAALVILGIRWWRGLPIAPAELIARPKITAIAVAATPKAAAPTPAVAPTALATPTGTPLKVTAPWRDKTSPAAEAPSQEAPPALARDWSRDVSVVINSSRYVKSLADLNPAIDRAPLRSTQQAQAARAVASRHEMLMVCNVTVEYTGAGEVTLDQKYFRLSSSEREVFPAVPIDFPAGSLRPLRATLLANGSATGDLVFAVKHGAQPDEILYKP